jgi:hypothetical protein
MSPSAPTVSSLINTLANDMGPGLLRGWAQIAAYCGKSPCQLRRYRDREQLPIARWGGHVYSDCAAISTWLLAREKWRRQRKRELAVTVKS